MHCNELAESLELRQCIMLLCGMRIVECCICFVGTHTVLWDAGGGLEASAVFPSLQVMTLGEMTAAGIQGLETA